MLNSVYRTSYLLFGVLSGHVIKGTPQYTYSTYSYTYRIVAVY